MVRIHPDPPLCLHKARQIPLSVYDWGISSAGRAPALQAGGRRFDPVILHQSSMPSVRFEHKPGITHWRLSQSERYDASLRKYRLSFFNNQEEVVKRFIRKRTEMAVE